jgi:glutamate transport system substrate-binding protein
MRPILRLACAAVCGMLLLVTACESKSAPPEPTPGSTSASDQPSIFDSGVNIAVKFDQPGFNYEDFKTQNSAGFETDLAYFLKGKIGFADISLNDEPSKRRETVLTKGTAQLVIATYSITDEREELIDFAGPYLETKQGLLVREDSRISSREDTAGKLICTVEGSVSSPSSPAPDTKERLDALLPEAHTVPRDGYSACVAELRAGNFDAVWTDKLILHGFAERHDDVKVVRQIELGAAQRYGVGIREGRNQDCDKVAEALRTFLTSEWRKSFQTHFRQLAERDPQFEQHYKPDPSDIDRYSCKND